MFTFIISPGRFGTRCVLNGLLSLFIGLFSPALIADVLLIEEVRQAEGMDLPQNGQTQSEVQAQYGEPENRHTPIGNPPITRWDYTQWSVYFEHDTVLFTVLHKGAVLDEAAATEKGNDGSD